MEPFGIDEAWLDVTHSQKLFGTGEEIAHKIREGVKARFGITVSVGVSFNKTFAKLASDYKKPDAVTVFSPENWRERIFPLPVGALLFVGHSSEEKLGRMGVKTIGDLAALDRGFLQNAFGKVGEGLYEAANGLEESAVAHFGEREELKSVGNSITFPRDLIGEEDLRVGLRALADKVAGRLRRHGLYAECVSVSVKDTALCVRSKQHTLASPTDVSDELFDAAWKLLLTFWDFKKPVRALGLCANRVGTEPGARQMSLLEGAGDEHLRTRRTNREGAVDRIRARYGKSAIGSGALLNNDLELE